MKLREFLSYRNNCPICYSDELKILLHSTRKQTVKIEDNKLIVKYNLLPLNQYETKYIVSYSFELDDNSFSIDFYDNNNIVPKKYVPLHLIHRFIKLSDTLDFYLFLRMCKGCNQYYYASQLFRMNYVKCYIDELVISEECFRLGYKLPNNMLRSFRVTNSPVKNITSVEYSQIDMDEHIPKLSPYSYHFPQAVHGDKRREITLNLIELSNPENFIERLNKLIVFF
jgi:hypothetical protein